MYSNESSVTTSYERFLERNASTIEVLDSLGAHDNLFRIRPEKVLCNTSIKGRCDVVANGMPLYFDDDHLSNTGSRAANK